MLHSLFQQITCYTSWFVPYQSIFPLAFSHFFLSNYFRWSYFFYFFYLSCFFIQVLKIVSTMPLFPFCEFFFILPSSSSINFKPFYTTGHLYIDVNSKMLKLTLFWSSCIVWSRKEETSSSTISHHEKFYVERILNDQGHTNIMQCCEKNATPFQMKIK